MTIISDDFCPINYYAKVSKIAWGENYLETAVVDGEFVLNIACKPHVHTLQFKHKKKKNASSILCDEHYTICVLSHDEQGQKQDIIVIIVYLSGYQCMGHGPILVRYKLTKSKSIRRYSS